MIIPVPYFIRFWHEEITAKKVAVDVEQLVEWSLPTPQRSAV